MGQYHTVVAMLADDVDDVATIDRERLGAGAKLSEQSYTWDPDVGPRCRIPSAYSAALGLMILGPWRHRRIAVIGDYSEPADDVRCGYRGAGHLCELYGVGRDDTDTAVAMLAEATGFTSHRDEDRGGYIVSPDDLATAWPARLASTATSSRRPAANSSAPPPSGARRTRSDRSCSAPPGPSSTCCAPSPTDAAAATSRSPTGAVGQHRHRHARHRRRAGRLPRRHRRRAAGAGSTRPLVGRAAGGAVMGGTTFLVTAAAATISDAYRDAVADAHHWCGHGGYSGTIAEKSGYVDFGTLPPTSTPTSSPTCSSTPSATTAGTPTPSSTCRARPPTKPCASPRCSGRHRGADDRRLRRQVGTGRRRPAPHRRTVASPSWDGHRHDAALPVVPRRRRRCQARTGLVRASHRRPRTVLPRPRRTADRRAPNPGRAVVEPDVAALRAGDVMRRRPVGRQAPRSSGPSPSG